MRRHFGTPDQAVENSVARITRNMRVTDRTEAVVIAMPLRCLGVAAFGS